MLIGYGVNADDHENWLAVAMSNHDSQQLCARQPARPVIPTKCNVGNGFLVAGQVKGHQAVHTTTDEHMSTFGRSGKASQ
jgi:hypothetical protein